MAELSTIENEYNGWYDYSDLATASTPISITGGGGYIALTNDGAGAYTSTTYKPTNDGDIWDVATDKFDFTDLAVGDRVSLRASFLLTTTSVNTEVDVILDMAQGDAINYTLQALDHNNHKTTVTDDPMTVSIDFYMGNAETVANPAQIKIQSDLTCTVKVVGWYIQVQKRM